MRIFSLIFCMIVLNSYAQNNEGNITIDKDISIEIDSLVKTTQYGKHNIGELVFHVRDIKNSDEFRIENASDLFFFLEMQRKLNHKFMKSVCNCEFVYDTVKITGGQGYAGGVGFSISIYDDKSTGEVWLETTEKVYLKVNSKNVDFQKEIIIESQINDLTIAKPVSYVAGEIIKGKLFLKTEPFNQLNKKGELKQIEAEFDIIFTCQIAD